MKRSAKASLPGLALAALTALTALTGCASTRPPVAGAPATELPLTPQDAAGWRYSLVIDASSSASTLSVYRWRNTDDRLPRIEEAPYPRRPGTATWSKRVRPGLADFAGSPAEAAASLAPLIDYALEVVPGAEHGTTGLHLWATAGLRLLAPAERDAILSTLSDYLAATPFAASRPRVLSGQEEGVYGWLAVNYLLGHLEHGGLFPTVGALDLGGASTQITFAPLDYPRLGAQTLAIGGRSYQLYSHSYLGLGQDVVRDELAEPACFLPGYPLPGGATGRGDFAACRDAIRERLAKDCAADSGPCSLFGVYQPPLYGDFLAFSVYAYTADYFDLGGRLIPNELEAAGTAFCATSWQDLVARDPAVAEDRFVPRYCFAAAYVVELLVEGLGFAPATERINAPLAVQGRDTGWTLGALLYELAGDAD